MEKQFGEEKPDFQCKDIIFNILLEGFEEHFDPESVKSAISKKNYTKNKI